ncbi:peptide ABC transporter permease [Ammoniphilus oxalaticus]|uniref:Peptide ABC transporter permease n=1 Tax=Ammoniphilus oxalaticus TaxID=66863 RepID=A0A419SGU2_9BACL|nr:ABC transporter permease [Ammoniphilus oxalaticus]RKD23000.1 peptide ABC transporter permease [Ammoniphilus oxalaticus]
MIWINRRTQLVLMTTVILLILAVVLIGGMLVDSDQFSVNLHQRNAPPSWDHLFGTDWLGRDMFSRVIKGLSWSIGIGLLATVGSLAIALALGLAAATLGQMVDRVITWLVDLFLSLPHLVSLLLISFALGGGLKGVVVGIALTHWPSLTRIIRAEVMQLRSAPYVQIARQLGKTRWWIARRHLLPHLRSQLVVGGLLLFPHAILHEAAISFLGLGLSPHQPAIGIILSESMRYLSTGMWWLAFFPGLCLLLVARAFDLLGENARMVYDPREAHR